MSDNALAAGLTRSTSLADRARALFVPIAVASGLAGIGLVIYGAYGDPHAAHNQRSAVPFISAILVVAAAAVFALCARALRSVDSNQPTAGKWLGGFTAATVLSVAVFWTGLPLVLGTASGLLGLSGREEPTTVRRASTIALSVAGVIMAASSAAH
jgi:hypothetical protein